MSRPLSHVLAVEIGVDPVGQAMAGSGRARTAGDDPADALPPPGYMLDGELAHE